MSSIENKRKVAILGAGYVGASIAYALTLRNLADEIVLIDNSLGKARGEAADICHGIPFMGISNVFAGSYSDIADCGLIVIAAGRNRRKGENRSDLALDNIATLESIASGLKPYYNKGVILIVTNPVDASTYMFEKWMGLPRGYVFGTGCILDTSRLTSAVSKYVDLSTDNIRALVIGEHGEKQVPVWSKLLVAGIPIQEYCERTGIPWGDKQKVFLADTVRNMGTAIIADKERTHYGIATCVCYIADAVLCMRKTVVTVSSTLRGEYGIDGIALSVPSIISGTGIEKQIVERLEQDEIEALRISAGYLAEIQERVSNLSKKNNIQRVQSD